MKLTAATLVGAVPNRSARFLRRSCSSASTSSVGGAARLLALRPLGFVGAVLGAVGVGAEGAVLPKRAARAASLGSS